VEKKRLKVLVAEDEDLARRSLVALLEESGYSVVDARDGVEAVQKAAFDLPDVILMDIAMPIMDGFEAAERIRENARTANIPIIACTGVSREFEEWEDLFQSVIDKPFTAEVVVSQLERFTRKQ
jgi:CheY-like chemotaxis protein